jgi:plastocyanin
MNMKTALRSSGRCIAIFIMMAVFQACAGTQQAKEAAVDEKSELLIIADSFKFDPSVVRVNRLGKLTMLVQNKADSEHNITVKDPQGKVIADYDLPPGKTTPVNLDLKQAGKYELYCDKTLHTTMGMKGELVVTKGP